MNNSHILCIWIVWILHSNWLFVFILDIYIWSIYLALQMTGKVSFTSVTGINVRPFYLEPYCKTFNINWIMCNTCYFTLCGLERKLYTLKSAVVYWRWQGCVLFRNIYVMITHTVLEVIFKSNSYILLWGNRLEYVQGRQRECVCVCVCRVGGWISD